MTKYRPHALDPPFPPRPSRSSDNYLSRTSLDLDDSFLIINMPIGAYVPCVTKLPLKRSIPIAQISFFLTAKLLRPTTINRDWHETTTLKSITKQKYTKERVERQTGFSGTVFSEAGPSWLVGGIDWQDKAYFVCIWDYDVRGVASSTQCYGYLCLCNSRLTLAWLWHGGGGGGAFCGWGFDCGVFFNCWGWRDRLTRVITGWPPLSITVLLRHNCLRWSVAVEWD